MSTVVIFAVLAFIRPPLLLSNHLPRTRDVVKTGDLSTSLVFFDFRVSSWGFPGRKAILIELYGMQAGFWV